MKILIFFELYVQKSGCGFEFPLEEIVNYKFRLYIKKHLEPRK